MSSFQGLSLRVGVKCAAFYLQGWKTARETQCCRMNEWMGPGSLKTIIFSVFPVMTIHFITIHYIHLHCLIPKPGGNLMIPALVNVHPRNPT